jgi:hypothetical protein
MAGAKNGNGAIPRLGEVEVPSLESVSPRYAELVATQRKLEAARGEIEAEISEIEAIRAGLRDRPRMSEQQAAALRLIGETTDEEVDRARVSKLPELRAAVVVHRRALDELRMRIAEEASRASRALCEPLRAAYVAHVQAKARALAAVHALELEYRLFVEKLEAEGVKWVAWLPPAPTRGLGDPRDPQSSLGIVLREWVQDELIPGDLIPDQLCYPPRENRRTRLERATAKLRGATA